VRVPQVFEPQPSLDWDTLNAEYVSLCPTCSQ
jgi:hypothetical protein